MLCGVCVVYGVVYDVCSQVLFVLCGVCVVHGVVYDVCSQVLFVWCVCVLCMVWCMMYVHRSFLCGVCVCCVWCGV